MVVLLIDLQVSLWKLKEVLKKKYTDCPWKCILKCCGMMEELSSSSAVVITTQEKMDQCRSFWREERNL